MLTKIKARLFDICIAAACAGFTYYVVGKTGYILGKTQSSLEMAEKLNEACEKGGKIIIEVPKEKS